MKQVPYQKNVTLLTVDEFESEYPQYGNHARSGGKNIYDKLMTPKSFIYGLVSTTIGLPAVAGIAYMIEDEIIPLQKNRSDFNYAKQFIGAVMCSLMEVNGCSRDYKKRSIPHPLFTKGEVFKKY